MKKYLIMLSAGLLLIGCKPTEKNYRNAYEKAYEASVRKAEFEQNGTTGQRLESIDGPRMEVIEGDTIFVGRSFLKLIDGDDKADDKKVGVAVAKYGVVTNAKRHYQDLSKEYPDATIATDGEDNYYVLIKRVKSIPESVDPIKIFRMKNPEYRYPGLNGTPVTYIISPN